MPEKTTIDLHGGKEHKNNTTLSSKKNTLEKTLNHKKLGKKETTLKTSREKVRPNKSTVMRIRIPHLTVTQIS